MTLETVREKLTVNIDSFHITLYIIHKVTVCTKSQLRNCPNMHSTNPWCCNTYHGLYHRNIQLATPCATDVNW